MVALVAQLLPLLEQIAAYDKEIADLFLTHEDNEVFSSLPGAGKRLAPRMLAEWGDDRHRYALCEQRPGTGRDSTSALRERQLRHRASTLRLHQAAA